MSLGFPWSAAFFFDLLPVNDVRLSLSRPRQINNLGGGEILTAELSPAFWQGTVSLPAMQKRRAAQIQARLAGLEAANGTFRVSKPHQIGPADDPLGVVLAGFSPVVGEISAGDAHSIKLDGMPQGFELQAGDFLAFDYDPGTGTRRAYHQITTGRAHDLSGGSAYTSDLFLKVVPELRPGVSVGASVQLVRPEFLAVLVPGSVSQGITRGNVTSGISFDFRQTLKA